MSIITTLEVMNTQSHDIAVELLRMVLPVAALVVSLIALWITKRNWLESNRPLVSAFVATHSGGNEAIIYNLVVMNSGARPAVNIRLSAEESAIRKCLASPNASERHAVELRSVLRCFSAEGIVPIILNGNTATNSFGHTGNAGGIGPLWQHGSSFPIYVRYEDLEGRGYKSRFNLVIRDSEGFGGGTWW